MDHFYCCCVRSVFIPLNLPTQVLFPRQMVRQLTFSHQLSLEPPYRLVLCISECSSLDVPSAALLVASFCPSCPSTLPRSRLPRSAGFWLVSKAWPSPSGFVWPTGLGMEGRLPLVMLNGGYPSPCRSRGPCASPSVSASSHTLPAGVCCLLSQPGELLC